MPIFSNHQMNYLANAVSAGRTAQTYYNHSLSLNSTYKKFGSNSYNLNGYINRFTTTGLTVNNFTLECWVYATGFNSSAYSFALFGGRNSTDSWSGFELTLYSSNIWSCRDATSAEITLATNSGISANTWNHIALCRTSSSITFFLNGTLKGTVNSWYTPLFDTNGLLVFGRSQTISGPSNTTYMDEIRLSNGIRYTSSFTPASSQFANDGSTILLCHCDSGPPLVDSIT